MPPEHQVFISGPRDLLIVIAVWLTVAVVYFGFSSPPRWCFHPEHRNAPASDAAPTLVTPHAPYSGAD